jgi:hypothetical protein
VSSTSTPHCTSLAVSCSQTGAPPAVRPTASRDPRHAGPFDRSNLASWVRIDFSLSKAGGLPSGHSRPLPAAFRFSARPTLAHWPRAEPRTIPAVRPAAATSRSRSCVPGGNAGWRPWCVPGAHRISARWNGRGISRSRQRSSPPAPISMTMGSAVPCMGGNAPMADRQSRTSAANGQRRSKACIPGASSPGAACPWVEREYDCASSRKWAVLLNDPAGWLRPTAGSEESE